MGLEERLARIEALLVELAARLERLEAALGGEGRVAVELAVAFALSAQESVRLAGRVVEALRALAASGGPDDDLSRAIVEALVARGPLSLRGLEREVRRLRGTASRAAIRRRLAELEEAGVVVVERRGRRLVVRLAGEE